jgi:hypothetical protein
MSRTDLIVENALLRQQLIVLHRQIKQPQLTNGDRFYLLLSLGECYSSNPKLLIVGLLRIK